ncbi:MAG: alpha/beta hydrolase [Deltaproteobacteria bacterium]|jgi:pimeloyl-ACP methyl ester carboxylesterase|nr:alpha/beta hydrolase [Deltaproteobacteria bacterium]
MSLQKPPKKQEPRRAVARFLVLVLLVAVAGVAIWAAVTNQRIDLIEDVPAATIELEDMTEVDGVRINVVSESGGPVPVIFLHDLDVAGSVVWDAVAVDIGERFAAVRIDLPGYGLSDRVPEPGNAHTVASMADVVGTVIQERFTTPVVLVGVGLGGQVAAETAATNPDMTRGLVMVDVDFWPENSWRAFAEGLPWFGRAVTHTFETGGLLGEETWAPNCETGGWCPSESQAAARRQAVTIAGSTDSVYSFRRTLPASLVPTELAKIQVPVVFVWSKAGGVPRESVDRVLERLPDMTVAEVEAWKAHLEAPEAVRAAIDQVGR